MSLAIQPISTVQALDPLTRINSARSYSVVRGGSRVTYKPITSTNYSNTSFSFTAPPPNPGVIVDRKLALRARVRITFVGTAPGGMNLLQSGFDAPRKNPLSSVMSDMKVTINNTSSSINLSDVIHPLSRYNTGAEVRDGELSVGPQMDDQWQRYQSGTATNRNPLGSYGDIFPEIPRGAFPFETATLVNTNTGAVVEFDVTEFLYMSPFMWGRGDKAGFIGVQTMDFTFNFGDLTRMWCHAGNSGSTLTSVTAIFYAQPTLFFKYISPAVNSVIPSVAIYPFFNVQRYPTSPGIAIAPNASTALSTQNIQLNSIPTRIYICARKARNTLTYTDTDTYLRINSISVNWNNHAGLLASASLQDLYRMCKKNGLNYSYPQFQGIQHTWSGGVNSVFGMIGSVLCICPGVDIGLNPDEAPGVMGTFQLQMDVNVTNINQTDTLTPELMIITVSEGTWTIMNNTSVSQIGVISRSDVVASVNAPAVDYSDIMDAYGGNFWSGLKKFGEDLWSGVKDVARFVAPIAKQVIPMVAPLLGLGQGKYGSGYAGGVAVGGRRRRRGKRGGALLGGKSLSRKQLLRMLG